MKKVTVSAPGKIHLMGEHAIVHGKPAILAAINKRLYATVSDNDSLKIVTNEDQKLIKKAIEVVAKKFNLKSPLKVKIEIKSAIPTGRHVGSSAAVSVAVISALTYFFKKIWNPNLFNELAYEVEKVQHGNPSGGDNTTVTFGGFIWYRKELEFLKSLWQLPFKPSAKIAPFVLIDTGRPKENTGEMVKNVADFKKKCPEKVKKLLDENEEAVKEVTIAIKEGDEKLLISAIKKGERTLEGLGVVSNKVIPLIREVEKIGGAAKILGGGGKTAAVGLLLCYHRQKEKVKQLIKKYHYPILDIKLGEEGVRLES